MLALVYVDRIIQSNPHFVVNSLNIHRLLITSVMLAAKFFDDQYFNNAYYSKVGGVPPGEMNSLEVEFLFMTNFTLFVPTETYRQYYTELRNHAHNSSCSCTNTKIPELVIPGFPDPNRPLRQPAEAGSPNVAMTASPALIHPSEPVRDPVSWGDGGGDGGGGGTGGLAGRVVSHHMMTDHAAPGAPRWASGANHGSHRADYGQTGHVGYTSHTANPHTHGQQQHGQHGFSQHAQPHMGSLHGGQSNPTNLGSLHGNQPNHNMHSLHGAQPRNPLTMQIGTSPPIST